MSQSPIPPTEALGWKHGGDLFACDESVQTYKRSNLSGTMDHRKPYAYATVHAYLAVQSSIAIAVFAAEPTYFRASVNLLVHNGETISDDDINEALRFAQAAIPPAIPTPPVATASAAHFDSSSLSSLSVDASQNALIAVSKSIFDNVSTGSQAGNSQSGGGGGLYSQCARAGFGRGGGGKSTADVLPVHYQLPPPDPAEPIESADRSEPDETAARSEEAGDNSPGSDRKMPASKKAKH